MVFLLEKGSKAAFFLNRNTGPEREKGKTKMYIVVLVVVIIAGAWDLTVFSWPELRSPCGFFLLKRGAIFAEMEVF